MSATNTSVTNNQLTRRSFTCSVCTVECTEDEPREILGYQFCTDCAGMLAGQFKDALRNELSYPPRWGDQEIPVEPFLSLLPSGFAVQYARKKLEYEMPLAKRLYCERRTHQDNPAPEASTSEICGHFLGERSKLNEYRQPVIICPMCKEKSCTDCGAGLVISSMGHVCEQSEASKDPFAELVRGKDYQICPNSDCGLKVQLWDGCNHLRCARCTEEFCRICGKEAKDGGTHWTREGGCPRWNHPDDSNAEFDAVQTDGQAVLGAAVGPNEWPAWAGLEPVDGVVATADLQWAREDLDEMHATATYLQSLSQGHIHAQTPAPAWASFWQPVVWKMHRALEIFLTLDQSISTEERASQQNELLSLWSRDARLHVDGENLELWNRRPDFGRSTRRFSDKFVEAESLLDYDAVTGDW